MAKTGAAPALAAGNAAPVVVVGAGLAGLAAAYRLVTAGSQVIVLEASERAGGRVRTERRAFAGAHAETGAARIADTHARVLDYVAQFDLALSPFTPAGAALLVQGGQASTVAQAVARSRDDPALHAPERGLSPAALLALYTRETLSGMADEAPDARAYAAWAAHDALTWPQWLQARAASDAAVARLMLGADSSRLSALYVLRQIALHRQTGAWYTLRDGMDTLARRLAQELGGRIRYRAPVIRIDRNADGARITYAEGGRTRTLDAARVVLATPLTTLRRIDITPSLPPALQRGIDEVAYYPAVRFLLQGRERFWAARDLSGAARSDRPAEIWDSNADRPDTAPILAATIGGELGWRVAAVGAPEALRLGVAIVDEALPGFARQYRRGALRRWSLEPWARGAFAAFAPGQMTQFMPGIAAPDGVLHFAGEHTSAYMSWMEGALRSGERAADEILAR